MRGRGTRYSRAPLKVRRARGSPTNLESLRDTPGQFLRRYSSALISHLWLEWGKFPQQNLYFLRIVKVILFVFYSFISGILVGSPTGRVFLSAECIAGQLRPMFQLKNVQYCMRKRKQTHIHILVFIYQFYSSHCPKKQKAHVTFVLGFNPSKLQNFPTNRVEKFINFSDKCKCAFSLFLCQNKHWPYHNKG